MALLLGFCGQGKRRRKSFIRVPLLLGGLRKRRNGETGALNWGQKEDEIKPLLFSIVCPSCGFLLKKFN